MPGEMLRVRDFHDVSRPLEGSSAHRMRTMRDSLVRGVRVARRDQDFARMVGAAAGRKTQLMNFTSFVRFEEASATGQLATPPPRSRNPAASSGQAPKRTRATHPAGGPERRTPPSSNTR